MTAKVEMAIKIWQFVGIDKSTLLSMREKVVAAIDRSASRSVVSVGETGLSTTFDNALLGEKLQAIDYALRELGE